MYCLLLMVVLTVPCTLYSLLYYPHWIAYCTVSRVLINLLYVRIVFALCGKFHLFCYDAALHVLTDLLNTVRTD